MTVNDRLMRLRELMKNNGVDAYVVPTCDFHGSEYIGDYFKTREFISGFTGSAGTAVITMNEALLWTDGRYFLQAKEQLDGSEFVLVKEGEANVPTVEEYLYIKTLNVKKNNKTSCGKESVSVENSVSAEISTSKEYSMSAENSVTAEISVSKEYSMSAENSVTCDSVGVSDMAEEDWLDKEFTVGFDGRMMTSSMAEDIAEVARVKSNIDLVGEIWEDRPSISCEPIWELPIKYAGKSRIEKISDIRTEMKKEGCDVLIMTSLDEIAWTLNLRGNDVECNPVFLSFLVITEDECKLFANKQSCTFFERENAEKSESEHEYIGQDDIETCDSEYECIEQKDNEKSDSEYECIKQKDIEDYESVYNYIAQINNKKIWIDKETANYEMVKSINASNTLVTKFTPVLKMKAIKNDTEIKNMRKAHLLDGIAMTKFIYWLKNNVGKVPMTEISLGEKLEEFRGIAGKCLHSAEKQTRALADNQSKDKFDCTEDWLNDEQNKLENRDDYEAESRIYNSYLGPSFAPIVGYKEHGAIVHYSATEQTDYEIKPENIVLIDSGGQYMEGTTDVTRTISLGSVTEKMRQMYTAVLRGHLNLMSAVFKEGCTGVSLDYLARKPLWELGVDYNHGTGHGVGCLLNVHESPVGIRYRIMGNPELNPVLKAGMISSDEPGVYLEGEFGIRIENLILCVEKEKTSFGRFLTFESLTLVPYDKELINIKEMTAEEQRVLKEYNDFIYEKLSPYLNEKEREWLKKL